MSRSPARLRSSILRPTAAAAAFALSIAGAPLGAQDGTGPEPTNPAPTDPNHAARHADWPQTVPIHTQADDPEGGSYGVWAAGPGFKVSFGPGTVTFHPAGDADTPWTWTTESIAGRPVRAAERDALPTHFTADRFETRHAHGVVEAYDLLESGIEQSFVVPSRPEGLTGDLTVTGRVDGAWQLPESATRHQALTFSSATSASVHYGHAFAIDAHGRRLQLPSTWDGARITLTVPAAFAATAAYPLTIDPIVRRDVVRRGTHYSQKITSVDVVRDDQLNQLFVAFTQASSIADEDLLLYRCDDDFSNARLVFADITSSWSTREAEVSTVGGAGKCVTVFHRVFSSTRHLLRWHTRALGDSVLGSQYGSVPSISGYHDWRGDVGGSRAFAAGDHALLVWQRDRSGAQFANTDSSEAMWSLLDVSAPGQGTLSTPSRLHTPGTGFDQDAPNTVQMAEGGTNSGWPIVWQEWGSRRGTSQLAWDGRIRRVNVANGGVLSTGVGTLHPSFASRTHCLHPTIAGETGRYLVSFAEAELARAPGKTTTDAGFALTGERVDWSSNRTSPSFPHPPHRRLHDTARRYVNAGIAYDNNSRSHWTALHLDTSFGRGSVERLSYRARSLGRFVLLEHLGSTPVVGGVTFDDDNDRFAYCYGRADLQTTTWVLDGYLDSYTSTNPPTVYGRGCTSTQALPGWQGTTYAGDEFSAATLTNAPPRTAGVLWFARASASMPLDHLGMTGCELNLPLAQILDLTVPISISSRGSTSVSLPLPEDFPVARSLSMQWLLLEPGVNPLGVTATRGLRITVAK